MTGILCSAIVDVIRPSSPRGLGTFRVEVWGQEPHDYVRCYTIQAKNDNSAAQQGLARFQQEISELINQEG